MKPKHIFASPGNFKNPRRFLYRFGRATLALILKCNTVPCLIFRGISFLNVVMCDVANYARCLPAFSRLHLMWAAYNLEIYMKICLIISVKKTDLTLVVYWWRYCRWTRCIICHIAHRSWQHFKMKFLWRYGKELCFTLELIQTLHAWNDTENCMNF